ncbi:MAG: ketohexokinase [Candidatus Thiodiazotropha sp. (ex Monitilora ramsayi)]|nr:ketohexokinase [Candidatus Thiodiazotropha sp. (ex Monitilora ramsayi)]
MRVLGVGVATLDIVDTVERFPTEDLEIRAESRRLSRGGNAATTLVVLSQFGHECSWAGALADDASAQQIVADFSLHGIDISWAETYQSSVTPTSYILLSRESASRTIIHYRDLPEFDHEAFSAIDLNGYDWIHFEGRNVPHCGQMLTQVRQLKDQIKVSLEVEKPREGIEALFPLADVLIFSRAYVEAAGYEDPRKLFSSVRRDNPSASLFAAWGEEGGWCFPVDDKAHFSSAHHPRQVCDTLGAGDVFNAGVIHSLASGNSAKEALDKAIKLAGLKCGQIGFEGLGDLDV